MRKTLYYIWVWLRRVLGLGPKRKFVNIYFNTTNGVWRIRPIVDVPSRACIELRDKERVFACDDDQAVIVHTVLELIHSCQYSNEYSNLSGNNGWKRFVEEHVLIVATLKYSSLCFEPWVRKQKGHKSGYYAQCLTGHAVCAPAGDVEKVFSALCGAKELAIKYEV